MLAATGNNHNDNISTNNWTNIINQDARSMDDAYLGKVNKKVNKINELKENLAKTTSAVTSISIPRIDKEEISKKLTHSAIKVKKYLFQRLE